MSYSAAYYKPSKRTAKLPRFELAYYAGEGDLDVHTDRFRTLTAAREAFDKLNAEGFYYIDLFDRKTGEQRANRWGHLIWGEHIPESKNAE